jgi:hypothetical protein
MHSWVNCVVALCLGWTMIPSANAASQKVVVAESFTAVT